MVIEPRLPLDYLREVVVEISNCTLFFQQANPIVRIRETVFAKSHNSLGTQLQSLHFLVVNFYQAACGNVEKENPAKR